MSWYHLNMEDKKWFNLYMKMTCGMTELLSTMHSLHYILSQDPVSNREAIQIVEKNIKKIKTTLQRECK